MVYAFDMGNVVIRNIEVNHRVIKLLGVNPEEFELDYNHYVFPMMDGFIPVEAYYRHLEEVFQITVPGAPFSDLFDPSFNEPMVEILKALKARGERIICVSNTYEPHWRVIQERNLDQYFDSVYLSHEMGLSKPSAAYFRSVMEKEGVGPEEMVYTDDREENVEAAKRLGMKTFLYSFDKTQEELESFYLI